MYLQAQQGRRQLESELGSIQGTLQEELGAAAEAKLKSNHGMALQQLRGIVNRLVKGEVRYRLLCWREQNQGYAKRSQILRLGSEAEAEQGGLSQALRREQSRRIATSQVSLHPTPQGGSESSS